MKKAGILAMLLAGALVCGIGVGCGENGEKGEGGEQGGAQHTHTFAEGWTSDGENHWHAATCDHKEEVSGKEAHSFTNGECSVCGYYKIDKDTDLTALVSDELTEEEWKEALSEEVLDNFKMYGGIARVYTEDYSFVGKSIQVEMVTVQSGTEKKDTMFFECKNGKYGYYATVDDQGTEWEHKTLGSEKEFDEFIWDDTTGFAAELRSLKEKFAQVTFDETIGAYLFTETDETHGIFADTTFALKFKNGKLCAIGGAAKEEGSVFYLVYGYGEATITPPTDFVEAE